MHTKVHASIALVSLVMMGRAILPGISGAWGYIPITHHDHWTSGGMESRRHVVSCRRNGRWGSRLPVFGKMMFS